MGLESIVPTVASIVALVSVGVKSWTEWRKDKREAKAVAAGEETVESKRTAELEAVVTKFAEGLMASQEKRIANLNERVVAQDLKISEIEGQRDQADAEVRFLKRRCSDLEIALVNAGVPVPKVAS